MRTSGKDLVFFGLLFLAYSGAGGGCQKKSGGSVDLDTALAPSTSPSHFIFNHHLASVIKEETPELKTPLQVRNHTDERVTFQEISPSCACSEAKLESYTLAPGEETSLHVTVSLRGRNGPQRFSVALIEPSGRYWQYLIETTVYQRAKFSTTNNILHLENLEPDALATAEGDSCLRSEYCFVSHL